MEINRTNSVWNKPKTGGIDMEYPEEYKLLHETAEKEKWIPDFHVLENGFVPFWSESLRDSCAFRERKNFQRW